MKRIFAATLAFVTAVLPPAVSAADVIGPVSPVEGRGTPASEPLIGTVPLLSEGLAVPGIDLNGALPISASADASLPSAALSATASAQAAVAPAKGALPASAAAQAQSALPTAEQQRGGAVSSRGAGEKVFSGARAASSGQDDLSDSDGVVDAAAGSAEAPGGPALERPTGRGPPSRREPPAGGRGGGFQPEGKKLAAVGLALVAGVLILTPASTAALGFIVAQAHVVAADFARHGVAFGIVSAVSAAGYDFSNVVGFLYPLTQVHALFKARSGKVSLAQQVAGMGSSLLLAFNMFYLNKPGASTLFSAYQNLFGGLTFGAIIAQVVHYSRRPGAEGEKPRTGVVMAQTAAVIAVVTAAAVALGAGMTGWLPHLHAAPLIVPFQMLLGFGFAYLTLPGYLKIEREKSVGAASFGTTAMFFAANASLVVWAIYRLATLPGIAATAALTGAAGFAAVATIGSLFAFRWLATRKWDWIPEKIKIAGREIHREALVDVAAFVVVSAFMTALVAAGYGVLEGLLHIPQAQQRDALTFLFYLVDVILASTSAALTMKAFRKYKRD